MNEAFSKIVSRDLQKQRRDRRYVTAPATYWAGTFVLVVVPAASTVGNDRQAFHLVQRLREQEVLVVAPVKTLELLLVFTHLDQLGFLRVFGGVLFGRGILGLVLADQVARKVLFALQLRRNDAIPGQLLNQYVRFDTGALNRAAVRRVVARSRELYAGGLRQGMMFCTEPLPKVVVPMMVARL